MPPYPALLLWTNPSPPCWGPQLLIEEGDDVADVAGRVASERGTTYVMIGEPRSMRGLRRFGESLPERLLRKAPGVDIRIVSNRARLPERVECVE